MKSIVLSVLLIFSQYILASSIEPQEVNENHTYLCENSAGFVKAELSTSKEADSSVNPKVIIWRWNNIEVVSVVHLSTCGNLGCAAIVSFMDKEGCSSKEIIAVQPHIPISMKENIIELSNVSGCTAWALVNNKVINQKCR